MSFSTSTRQPALSPDSRILVNLDHYQHNLRVLKRFAPRAQQMAIVKADAYGHGALAISQAACAAGAQWLGVAQLSEALNLRKSFDQAGFMRDKLRPGPTAAVLASRLYQVEPCPAPKASRPRLFSWIYSPSADLRAALHADIDLSISTVDQLAQVAKAADRLGVRARVHIEVDTGMARGGARLEDLADLCVRAHAKERSGLVEVNAIWSHFARADEPTPEAQDYTYAQINAFHQAFDLAREAGLNPLLRHMAASAGIIWYPESHFELVRPGIAAYGLSPNLAAAKETQLDLRPVARLEAEVTQVKRLRAGDCVSYGSTFCAQSDCTVALVPVGYADGLPRAASGAPVWIAGRLGTVVGRVCMDQVIVKIEEGEGGDCVVSPGDLAVFFGDPADVASPDFAALPTAHDWAQAGGTIAYEVTTALSSRLDRVFLGAGR